MNAKSLAVRALAPAALLAEKFGEPLRRAWAHARFATGTRTLLDASVVILGVVELRGSARIRLGRDLFLYRGLYLETQEEGSIEIGNGVVISRGVHIVSYAQIEIGDGAMIGEYTSIRDANHRLAEGKSVRYSGHQARPIRIGRNAWIGRGVTILPGVTIGANAVVGANSVVTSDIPARVTAVGIPARPLMRRQAV